MFYKLEALRGIAAVCVVFFHSPFLLGDAPLRFFANSYLFVDFFFALSGFVLTHTYQRRIRDGMPLRDYTLLRLARLYPLHLLTLLAWVPLLVGKYWLFTKGIGDSNPFDINSPASFVSNLFLIHSLGIHDQLSWNVPSWSISCEMAAYLVFFLLLRTLDRHRGFWLPITIALASYAVLFSVSEDSFDLTFDYGVFRCLGAFYLGVLVYRLKQAYPKQAERVGLLQIPLLLILPVLIANAEYNHLFMALTLLSFPLLVLAFASKHNNIAGRTLETRPLMALGRWSYSIYMTHAIIVFLLSNAVAFGFGFDLDKGMGWLSLPANLVYFGIVVLTSFLTFTYVEKPAQNWLKKRIRSKRDTGSVHSDSNNTPVPAREDR